MPHSISSLQELNALRPSYNENLPRSVCDVVSRPRSHRALLTGDSAWRDDYLQPPRGGVGLSDAASLTRTSSHSTSHGIYLGYRTDTMQGASVLSFRRLIISATAIPKLQTIAHDYTWVAFSNRCAAQCARIEITMEPWRVSDKQGNLGQGSGFDLDSWCLEYFEPRWFPIVKAHGLFSSGVTSSSLPRASQRPPHTFPCKCTPRRVLHPTNCPSLLLPRPSFSSIQ